MTMRISEEPRSISIQYTSQPIAVAQGNIEYVERSVIPSDGDVEADINTRLAKAATVFRVSTT